jgi:phage shock protein B
MQEVLIVAVVFGSILLVTAIIAGVILGAIRMIAGKGGIRGNEQEAQLMQELYQGLERMEQRVESLETILMEQQKKSEERIP